MRSASSTGGTTGDGETPGKGVKIEGSIESFCCPFRRFVSLSRSLEGYHVYLLQDSRQARVLHFRP